MVRPGSFVDVQSSLWRETAQNHDHYHHHHRRRNEHCSAFSLPSSLCRAPSSSHSSSAATRDSLQPRMASFGAILESRRARILRKNSGGNATPTAVANDGSTQNSKNGRELPAAHMFSVRRRSASQGSQRLLFPIPEATGAGRGDGLNSPRFAAAAGGQSYPERLSVSVNSQVAEGDVFVDSAKGGRPLLPELSEDDLTQLRAGQRVQHQQRDGGSGTGSVVVDVRADPDVVLEYLTKYEEYDTMIDTVRECQVFPSNTDNQRKVRRKRGVDTHVSRSVCDFDCSDAPVLRENYLCLLHAGRAAWQMMRGGRLSCISSQSPMHRLRESSLHMRSRAHVRRMLLCSYWSSS